MTGTIELRWRVVKNDNYGKKGCNEMKYTLISVFYNPKTNLIREQGSRTWKHHNCDLFLTRKRAEKWLCELNYNEHCNRAFELEKKFEKSKKAVEILEKVNSVLADAIIEVTESLDNLSFNDLEKIARCFENKIDNLIKECG